MKLFIQSSVKKVTIPGVVRLCLPGIDAPFEIYKNHAKLVALLSKGKVVLYTATKRVILIEGGMVSVANNIIFLLT